MRTREVQFEVLTCKLVERLNQALIDEGLDNRPDCFIMRGEGVYKVMNKYIEPIGYLIVDMESEKIIVGDVAMNMAKYPKITNIFNSLEDIRLDAI